MARSRRCDGEGCLNNVTFGKFVSPSAWKKNLFGGGGRRRGGALDAKMMLITNRMIHGWRRIDGPLY